jgi:tetratricopeptide (TPR) repeat protein
MKSAIRGARRFCLSLALILSLAEPLWAQYGKPGEPLYDSMDKAFAALRVKDYDRAIEQLNQAAKLAPDRPDIFKQLGYAYIKTGQTDGAIGAFEKVVALSPSDYRSLLQLAFLYDRSMRDEDAAAAFEKVAAGSDKEAAQIAASSLKLLGDKYKEEIARLRSNIISHPDNMASRAQLGELLLKTRQTEAGVEQLQAVADADAADPQTAYDLGRAYLKLGKGDEGHWNLYLAAKSGEAGVSDKAKALLAGVDMDQLFRRLVTRYPAENRYRRALGFRLMEQHSTAAATEQFEQAVAQNGKDGLARMSLGYLYAQAGQMDKARAQFAAVVAANDPAWGAKAETAISDIDRGIMVTAPGEVQAAQQRPAPQGAEELKNAGYRLRREGKIEDAIAVFKQLHELVPTDFSVEMQIGYWCWDLKALEDARYWFELAAGSPDPAQAASARKALGEVVKAQNEKLKQSGYRHKDAGDNAGAIRDFETIVQSDPSDYNAMLQLGYWAYDEKNLKQAERWFRRASLSPDAAEAAAARVAAQNVSRAERLYWGSIYFNPFYTTRFDDFLYYSTVKVGVRVPAKVRIEPYLSLRLQQDTRSRGGALPEIFSDSAAVIAAGVQVHPFTPWLNVFAEAGTAISLLGTPPPGRGRAIPDYRAGIAYARNWGTTLTGTQEAGRGFFSRRGFREIWTDTEYYSRFGDNVIGYFQYKEGLKGPSLGALRSQFFVVGNLVKDARSDFYNNAIEGGPGARFSFTHMPWLQFYCEYVRGAYLTKGHRTRNYGPANYNDVRVFVVYSKWF